MVNSLTGGFDRPKQTTWGGPPPRVVTRADEPQLRRKGKDDGCRYPTVDRNE